MFETVSEEAVILEAKNTDWFNDNDGIIIDNDVDNEINATRLFKINNNIKNKENLVKKRHMLFIEQNTNKDFNKDNGWSNPILSNTKELNDEVKYYQSILLKLKNDNNNKELEDLLNESFKRIAGYYSNYEYRWYEKMGHLFEEPDLFYDFFYDLLRDCLEQFDDSRTSNHYDDDKNFRKAKSGVYFNQYFFGALSKRKITNLKKTLNTYSHPSVICEVCGENVTKITNFHLQHCYDEAKIKKEFKVVPVMIGDKRIYDECPICGDRSVDISHLKNHHYAKKLTIQEYVDKYPHSPLSGKLHSLQEPLSVSDNGDMLTIEDIYQDSVTHQDLETEINLFSSHIDEIFSDEPFVAQILKLKIMDYKDREIAEKLSESVAIELTHDISKNITKKSQLYNYMKSNGIEIDFINKYKTKFHIVKKERNDDKEIWYLSSCIPSQINVAIKKLRKNKTKIKELFGNFNVPNV